MKAALLKDKLSSMPEINVERGMRYSVGNVKNYRKALYMVLKSVKFKVPIMINMMEEKEYDGLRVIVHTLMQLLENIGADSLVKECERMEVRLLNNQVGEVEDTICDYIEQLTGFVVRLERVMPGIDSIAASSELTEAIPSTHLERRMELLDELKAHRMTKVV